MPSLGSLRSSRGWTIASTGGAPLLGVNGVTLIGHGRSNSKAVYNAVKAAIRTKQDGVVESIVRAVGSYSKRSSEV